MYYAHLHGGTMQLIVVVNTNHVVHFPASFPVEKLNFGMLDEHTILFEILP